MKKNFLFSLLFLWVGVFLVAGAGFSSGANPSDKKSLGKDAEVERLLMEGTEIKGTVEKPHVVYVVPWKEPPSFEQEDISYRRSFYNEIIEPIDRESFIRKLDTHSTPQKEVK